MVECARLESVYTARYRGFESLPLRQFEVVRTGQPGLEAHFLVWFLSILRFIGHSASHLVRDSKSLRVCLISAARSFSLGRANLYSEARILLGNPSRAYLATAESF